MPKTVKLHDKTFTLAEQVNEFALMEFAGFAADGVDGDTMQGMAAIFSLIKTCIVPEDWQRFRATARKTATSTTELMAIIAEMFKAAAERPTSQPSDSTDGLSTIEPSSVVSAGDKVLMSETGRPDRQIALVKAMEQMPA